MALAFCVYPVTHDDNRIFIFGSTQSAITIATNDSDGGMWLDCRDPSTGLHHSITIPGVLASGQWHSVMISAYPYGSPSRLYCKVWINGVEEYAGDWNPDFDQVAPMDWSGRCYVGAGDFGSGSAPGHDPDFWEGLDCYLSYVWAKETALDPATNWNKFFDANNRPRWLGTTGERVTGSAADTYCPNGDFTDNWGTGPNWTEIGTVADAPSSPSD
jgi:hypothetical protein